MEMFRPCTAVNPVEEFQRTRQTGRVEEYIKQFQKAKARLICRTRIKNEDFYLLGFIGGLKEEIKNSIDLFTPTNLMEAFKIAKQIELSHEGFPKKTQNVVKQFSAMTSRINRNQEFGNKINTENTQLVQKPRSNAPNSLSIEQMRALGLCFRCKEKFHPGHKCVVKGIHALSAEEVEGEWSQENEFEIENGMDTEESQPEPQDEHAMITVCDTSHSRTLKFKGYIGQIPVIALMDSGSTHSFVSPTIINNLG